MSEEATARTETPAEGAGPQEKMRGLIATLTAEPRMKVDAPERFARLNAELAKLAEQADAAEPATTRFGTPEELEVLASDEADAAAADAQVEGEARLAATHAALDALTDAVDGEDLGLDWLNDAETVPPGVDAAVEALVHLHKGDMTAALPRLNVALDGMRASAEAKAAVRRAVGADLPEGLRAMLAADVLLWALNPHAPAAQKKG